MQNSQISRMFIMQHMMMAPDFFESQDLSNIKTMQNEIFKNGVIGFILGSFINIQGGIKNK